MRVIVFALIILSLVSVSICWANEAALKEAYDLYYKGDKEAGIEMMENYIQENPDPKVLYFLGYAYYEKQEMDRAREYFTRAFELKDFYSPMSSDGSQ